jgi:acyl-CoA-binding protein
MELEDVLGLLSTLDKREIPDEEFAENAALSQGLMPALDDMQKLILYGLYKQTVSGNAPKQIENIDKASPEYYKWQAWRSFFDLSRNDAKRLYVYFVNQYQQVAEISAAGKKSGRDIEGVGSSVSTL